MRKRVLIIMLLMFTFLLPAISGGVYAWDDCPKGLVNDEYPGECSRYVDTDGNGICDHSEPAPEDRVDNENMDTETAEKQTESSVALADNDKTENTPNKGVMIFLSIFIPLVVLVGYASVYKIKQNKK
jgi:hypothetical protein